jgi:hypothetical protein
MRVAVLLGPAFNLAIIHLPTFTVAAVGMRWRVDRLTWVRPHHAPHHPIAAPHNTASS